MTDSYDGPHFTVSWHEPGVWSGIRVEIAGREFWMVPTTVEALRGKTLTMIYRHDGERHMNKLMAILFLFGAIGGFGLSQRDSFQTQSHTSMGAPVGEPRSVQITRGDRAGYIAFGVVCMVGCLYFVVRIRCNDLRR